MPAGDLSSIDELMLVEHVRIGHSHALGFKVKRGTLLLEGRASFYKWLLVSRPVCSADSAANGLVGMNGEKIIQLEQITQSTLSS